MAGETLTRRLAAAKSSVGMSRDLVANTLGRWGLADLAEDAVLVISELATNAVGASRAGQEITVHLRNSGTEIILAVHDNGPGTPRHRQVDLDLATLDVSERNFDANGGWGLSIVAALAARCWVDPGTPAGKWVCAALRIGPARGGRG
ncbi:hypothetical protein DPM19_22965 [Actinomadura craniellae]|uniref:Histidine kinase/HSP90-like ATPase domain-containing protein n=2 Tax=Actinomadura craniellae TaxID=2231787 RepID=A0A365H1G6_9ACTN|nr:hypothetical protein DPM19_22965 [Actinomadura craniellae]